MMSEFSVINRDLKCSLVGVMEWSKDLEEKYQSMAILVETLSQLNFKKDKKIKQLKKKVQKYKSLAKAKKLRTNPLPTTTPDGKHVIIYQELLDLTEEPDFEEEEEEEQEEVVIIEKENIKIKIKEEPNTPIAPPSTPNNEVVEIEEEEEVEETILEKEVVEEDIEPALEPDSEDEEPEMQPTEEPVLEKEVEEVVEEVEVEEKDGHTEEAEEELYELEINGKAYYVVNETNGPIYAVAEDEEVGDEIGKFVNGKPVFQQDSSTAPKTETTEEEEEEVDLYQVKINGTNYAVENETDGPIYELVFDGDVGEQVGQYVKGKPTFFKK